MDSNKYLEGQFMQRTPFFESEHFIYWKNRFDTYVKAKDLDLWYIILNSDFLPVAKNKVTQILEVVPFEEQSDDLKKKLAKNNEAKTVLYNGLPNKDYERIFTCETAKDICLKALDEGFSSKNYVRKFLRALHPKWRAKVTAIEESKDLSSLDLDELIGSLKVHAMAVRNFKKQPKEEKKLFRQMNERKGKSEQKCFRCDDPNHLIGNCPKSSRNKDQKAFIGGSWSDSENDAEDKTNDETCLMAQSSNEVTLNSSYYSDNASFLNNDNMQIEYDSLCEISLKIINKNKTLKTKRDLLEKEVLELNDKIKKLERSKEIDIACKLCQDLKLENARLKETQAKFVKFDKSANSLREMLDNQKSSSCKVDLGFDSNKASTSGTKPIIFVGSSAEKAMDGSTIKVHGSTLPGFVSRTNGEKLTEHVFSPPMPSRSDFVIIRKKLIHNRIDKSKKPSLKPSLKSKPNYVYKLKKALYGLKQAPKAWYDRLKAFLIKHEYSIGMVDNTLFTKKSKTHIIIVQIYVDEIIFGSTCQSLCNDFAKIMHDEFEMSMMGELNFLGLQIKQMEDRIFFNQSKYIKEMLKKFKLEDSKPTKTSMLTEIKLTKNDEPDSMDSSKYRGMIGSLLYLTASRPDIMFSVCLCARFQENPKTTHLEVIKSIFRFAVVDQDFMIRMSGLLQEIFNAYDKKVDFIRELEAMLGVDATVKTIVFSNENLWKDEKRLQKLRNMKIDNYDEG
uniref:Retrovirus-related Pol polyprotein from transposon TNT 1-94 n=1 Tax=Tanacetum cinerariifolium TaxID=118510 RepID=A0A6L2KHG2_TANCI|nr:retrovirus-related Pol polyprotein from transposon TNT 1-94 [Tanacetum cinerariifolium]